MIATRTRSGLEAPTFPRLLLAPNGVPVLSKILAHPRRVPKTVRSNRNLRFALPWVRGDTVIASFYDEDGTIMVKRYRMVPPAHEEQ
jgi:hypothetical protein